MTNVLPLSIQSTTKVEEKKNTETPGQLLEATLNAVEQWRNHKKSKKESFPEELCRKIFSLELFYSPTQLRRFFKISGSQYRAKREKYLPTDKKAATAKNINAHSAPPKEAPPKLCQIKIKPDNPYALESLPSTKTLVVEFCRNDGQIMKIHTTQDSIPTLMHTFLGSNERC